MLSGISPMRATAAELDGHKLVASSDTYELYMSEDDLSIIVKNKANGKTMESYITYDDGKNNETWLGAMHSALVLTLIYSSVDTLQADLVCDNVTKNITYLDNGFKADVYWTKYKLGLTLEVTLEGDEIVATIPDESIREDGDTYDIGTISVYPFLGNSYNDSKEGYMYIPDGNGALIYLDDKEGRFSSGYASLIYGDDIGFDDSFVESLLWDKYSIINDSEQIIAPTFGIAHTDDGLGFLGIVEGGAQRAYIVAQPNGCNVNYNRVYPKFLLRKLYTQPTSNNTTVGSFRLVEEDHVHTDFTVRYVMLANESANYTGMATAYRNYLLDNGKLKQSDTSYRTRVDFLGSDREDWIIGTSAVVMTRVSDIADIYEDLKASDVSDIISVYKGWQSGGIYDLPITGLKVDSKLGSKKALKELIGKYGEEGIKLYLYCDALRINPSEHNATFNVIKKVNKKKYEEETYKDVYEKFQYLTPSRSTTLLPKLAKSLNNNNVSNLCVAGITNTLFTYSYSNVFYSRIDTANSYGSLIEKVDATTDLILEQPFSYLWKDTDAFLDMPLYTSQYIFEDTFVPFLSIVLKGVMPVYSEYVNFEANKQEFFLKLVETGTFPSFYITKESSSDLIYTNSSDIYTSQYSVFKDTIVSYADELKALNEQLEGAVIVSHDMFESGLTEVTYSNGITILINYSENEITQDGVAVDAMSYRVIIS